MTSSTVYLISGASRGIGFGLTEALAKRPDTIVFAGARDPNNATALKNLAKQYPNAVHIVKLTSASAEDNTAAVAEIKQKVGRLDVVIANAGISDYFGPITTTPIEAFTRHYNVNTLGPVVLFQAVYPLLLKSPTGAPQFNVISSVVGSIGGMIPSEASAYGSSKAAVNYVTKLIHQEHEADGLIAMAIHPGWVATDMGNPAASKYGLKEAPVTVAQSVAGILSHVDGATREEKSGKYWNFAPTSGNFWDINADELSW